ncbi:MAG: hypothetical protein OEZ59_11165 [Deltaproteobacteria bacterium]|nr:hypothetical protein [Deltaproteobacteria bacterium]
MKLRKEGGLRKVVTEEDVQRALKTFFKSGGIINRLPDEIVLPNRLVGGTHGMFEEVNISGS